MGENYENIHFYDFSHVANGIKNSRLKKNMSAAELCRLAAIPKSSLSDWENGKTVPSSKSLLKIMNVLNMDAMELIRNGEQPLRSNEEDNNIADENNCLNKITPFFDKLTERQKETVRNVVKAQLGISPNEKIVSLKLYNEPACAGDGNTISSDDYEVVEFVNPPKTAQYAVRAQGDSMQPRIEDGDILYVNPVDHLIDGDLGIFTYQGNTYVKQIRYRNGKTILHSLNPKYNDIIIQYPNEFYINGRVL